MERFTSGSFPEVGGMNNAMEKASYQRWLASVRVGGQVPRTIRDDLKSLPAPDQQDTTVQRLPKDVVQRLRERAMQGVIRNEDPTTMFRPSEDLLQRARRLDQESAPLEADEETLLWHKDKDDSDAQAEAFGKELQSAIREKRALALSRAAAAAAAAEPKAPTATSRLMALLLASLVAAAYVAISQWH